LSLIIVSSTKMVEPLDTFHIVLRDLPKSYYIKPYVCFAFTNFCRSNCYLFIHLQLKDRINAMYKSFLRGLFVLFYPPCRYSLQLYDYTIVIITFGMYIILYLCSCGSTYYVYLVKVVHKFKKYICFIISFKI
jgi:hypothetical protein